ncbi:unnamed protein product [Eruca vesicaria subsp. sativa]|uniref:Uncharacterized protein n=1 Tax=Eruca vesicaria subsp. sativa TaxID=29727 RepID=A0ABC8JUK5_ERUVS|nr:unnamed protein product [Eruca vesicaria subsp. sativa]
MTDAEKWMLEKQTARILASRRGEGTAEDEQWETPRVVSTRNGLGVKDRPQFKRNRAKVMARKVVKAVQKRGQENGPEKEKLVRREPE